MTLLPQHRVGTLATVADAELDPASARNLPQPRISTRRGSATATDPFNVHAELNHISARISASTLTIVRVPHPSPSQPRFSRPEPASPPRLSFGSSSFSSPSLRQSSPGLFQSKPRLTPDQLVDLAHQSTAYSGPSSLLSPHNQFTPLPDNILLPFVDRPSEVSSLISSPPDAKLFTLLAQTFGQNKDPNPTSPLQLPSHLPQDPAEWTYRHLLFHLTKVDRDAVPDTIWAYAVRRCIISHSELIWERVKGSLGIPPELDINWDFSSSHRDNPGGPGSGSDRDSIRTEDISDDEGRAARGHWADWDAIMDSPVFDRRENRFSMDSNGIGAFSPSLSLDMVHENQVTIEPLLAPPLPSSGPSDGLGDIAEGAEEEEQEQETQGTASPEKSSVIAALESNHLSPSQIHGLKISTTPLPIMHYGTPPVLSPTLLPASVPGTTATPGVANTGGNSASLPYIGSGPRSRSSSLSSIGPFKRADSGSNITVLLATLRAANPQAGSDTGDTSSIMSESHLGGDTFVGDYRTADNPLFPSNFTRLASSPTLIRKPSHARSRTYSHGASSLRGSMFKRCSWGAGSGVMSPVSPTVAGGNGAGSG